MADTWMVYSTAFNIESFFFRNSKKCDILPNGGGDSAHFVHRAPGTVIHPNTSIGKRVQIYQGVTIGKAKPWDGGNNGCCEIKDDVILCAGAKILFKDEKLVIGRGCVIGANSVLTQSTGEYEIWAGVPAKKIGNRER